MNQKERVEVRRKEFGKLMSQLELGLLPFLQTYGDFMDAFGSRMRAVTGDYTREDERWVAEALKRERDASRTPKRGKGEWS